MASLLFKRLLSILPTLFGILVITFFAVNLAPGDPASLRAQPMGGVVSDSEAKAIVEETSKLYGLDKPVYERFFIWLSQAATLDFGNSLKDKEPVRDKLARALPVTIFLNAVSLFLIYAVSIPAGIFAAIRRGGIFDKVSRIVMLALFSVPSFWLAVVLIWLFASGELINAFPIAGLYSDSAPSMPPLTRAMNVAWHLFLPILCLSAGGFAFMTRFVRLAFLDAMDREFMKAALAKGLSGTRATLIHAGRFALIPIITLTGTLLPALIGGSLIIEQIFAISGMGRLAFESVLARDYPVIMAIALMSAVVTMLGSLLADLACMAADPRMREKRG